MYNVHLCKVWKIELLRSGILRDKTMDDKLIYILNHVKNSPINLLVEKCSESLSEEDRLALLNSLQSTSLESTDGISPVLYISSNGTPYTLQVILDPNSPQIAPRRQAIAKDTRGIVVLKGQPSFSSSIKVLLDELKLRIDNQLP